MATDNTIDSSLKDNAALFAAAGLASDVLGSFFGAQQRRSQLRIQQEQKRINKILADAEFTRNMEALFASHNDLREKSTRELIETRKSYKQKQAELRVIQSDKGISGQSAADVANDLTRQYELFRQVQLSNLAKGERNFVLQREAAIDNRTASRLANALPSAGVNPIFDAVASTPAAALDAFITYNIYRDEASTPGELADRRED